MTHRKCKAEDFTVRVRPLLDKKHRWTGEIDVVIITSPRNEMSDDDYYQLMHICKMISSVIPMMEIDEDMRNKINNYVVNVFDNETVPDIKDRVSVKEVKDNIITVNFKRDTNN